MDTSTKHSIFERIKKAYPELSDARARVARFIVDHWDEVAFMSAAKVGEIVGVSETVVIRLAEALGYEGFSEMQSELQEKVRRKLDAIMVRRLDSTPDPSDESAVIEQSRQRDRDAVDCVFRLNSQDSLVSAASMILAAAQIYIVGLRASSAPAQFLAHNLSQMLGNAHCLSLADDSLFDQMRHVKPQDLVIAITFSRYSVFTFQAVRMAKARGVKVLAITDDVLAPVARLADKVLLAKTSGPSFGLSHTGTLALINAILEIIVHLDRNRVRKSLEDMEEMLNTYHPGINAGKFQL
ncbi:MAG: MurR/RpiR family transcriptional regulator [Candidatus Fermentithermobacillus carboniphilus]|uniref:MurR/RpiR family transcriptional regulator n=1 Tax=Candidatus Fermentithermobacillus carboniphilus TaxID=3085328 RepID=A0AAT9LDV7_9FIRM|nr:MAG: MurR/RpiR family transcriptional regulator [Candidatus Fermentithermobacillus carboniphilus]